MEDAERSAFRRALGFTLQGIRRKLTPYKSQRAIADALGVDEDTVGRWERGEREPRTSELVELWQRYDVPAEWLLQPTDSLRVLDGWIAELRALRLREAAAEAAREGEGDDDRPSDDGASPRHGRR